tara:strand:- start:118 stop:480 length:363 start_codon:yes stop_codon:yes gene_type:complete
MDGYLKRQLLNQNRGNPLAARRTESALYAGCLPQASGTGAHPLTVVRELASKGTCWEGYERVPGTKKYAEDSCRKKGSGGKKKKKKKKAKKEGDASSSSSSSSEDEDGKPKKKKAKKESE